MVHEAVRDSENVHLEKVCACVHVARFNGEAEKREGRKGLLAVFSWVTYVSVCVCVRACVRVCSMLIVSSTL